MPAELRYLLSQCDGYYFSQGWGLLCSVEGGYWLSILGTYRSRRWCRRDQIPLAWGAWGGVYCLLAEKRFGATPPVGFIPADQTRVAYIIASSLEAFLRQAIELSRNEIRWHSSKVRILRVDPGLARVKGYPLPWH